MLPGWLRVRLIDESYAQARSLTTSFLMYLMARALLIDQRMVSARDRLTMHTRPGRVKYYETASFCTGR